MSILSGQYLVETGGFKPGRYVLRDLLLVPLCYSVLCLALLPLSYQAFHFFAEFGSIVVGFMTLAVASISYRFLHNNFFLILAIGFGWCALLDMVHVAAYEGMNLLPLTGSNLATQLWIVARFLQAITLVSSIIFVAGHTRPLTLNLIMMAYCVLALVLIGTGIFPDTFVQGSGLTRFKIVAEYVIVILLAGAGCLLVLKKGFFTREQFLYITLAIAALLISELLFTFYLAVNDAFNAAGHILKVFAFWFVFRGLVVATVQKPFQDREKLLFDLHERIKELRAVFDISVAAGSLETDEKQLLEMTVSRLPSAFCFNDVALCAAKSAWGDIGDPSAIPEDRRIETQLKRHGETVATLYVGYPEGVEGEPLFLDEEYRLMEMLQSRLASFFENAFSVRRIKRLTSLYEMLSGANRTIVASKNEAELFSRIMDMLDFGGIFVFSFMLNLEEDSQRQAPTIEFSRDFGDRQETTVTNLAQVLCNELDVFRGRSRYGVFMFSELLEDREFTKAILDELRIEELLLIPLNNRHEVNFLLGLALNNPETVDDEFFQLLDEMRLDIEFALKNFEEVRKRKLAQTHAKETARNFEAIFERAPVPMVLLESPELDSGIVNQAFYDWAGTKPGETFNPESFMKKYLVDRELLAETVEFWTKGLKKLYSGTPSVDLPEVVLKLRDQKIVHVYGRLVLVGMNVLISLIDVTAIRRSEQIIKESEARFRAMIEDIESPVVVCRDAVLIYSNPYLQKLLGMPSEELTDKPMTEIFRPLPGETFPPKFGPDPGMPSRTNDVLIKTASGEDRTYRVQVSNIPWENERACISVGEDITERHRVEVALERSGKLLNDLSQQIPGVIYQFRLYPDGRSCFPFASENIWDIYEVKPEDVMEDASMVFERLHPDDRTQVEQKIMQSAEALSEWRDDYRVILPKQGLRWRSGFAIPKKLDDGSILWHGFIEDSTERMKVREALNHNNRQLELAKRGTLEVLTNMVDVRDPYTAGHENRVAKIACIIARHMGYQDESLDNFEIACLIHDVGKIAVPAEILSKPTKLTRTEFEMVKEHAEIGYKIVKKAALPEVIANTIWQHHERLDGSGYPRGLKGDEVSREARILAVADVLESMASHRPYRPALGVDAALSELKGNSGTRYDSSVVELVVKLVATGEIDIDNL